MRQVAPIKKKSDADVSVIKRRLHEGFFILFSAIAIYLFISLLSYHSSDPGWSNASQASKISNAGGRFGAWFSDFFLYCFGYSAYLFPILFVIPAWFLVRESTGEEELDKFNVLLRLLGFILTLISGCGLADLYWSNIHVHVPLNAGGIIGDIISNGLINGVSFIGSSVVLITVALVGIMLFTGLSWLSTIMFISRKIVYGFVWLKDYILILKDIVYDRFFSKKKSMKLVKLKKPKVVKIKESSVSIEKSELKENLKYDEELPSLSLLEQPQLAKKQGYSQERLEELSSEVESKLMDFGIEVKVVAFYPGPVITRFELELAPGLKVNKITALAKDLARSLSQSSVRVVEVIPGKSVIGIEIPNECREFVYLKELFESKQYNNASSPLSLALGKDISGHPVIVDLSKMPHMLVAGTTGSGKSVSLNTMVFSLLFKAPSTDVKFIMIDPKMLELSVYDGIPHLLAPVVTDMKEAANAFRWCVAEMERRYRLMASLSVRNLAGFNAKVSQAIKSGKPIVDPLAPDEAKLDGELSTLKPLPYIVIIVDELADMMMVVGKKVEELIARIAQKARAAGIHMILATQRPSVDVITGLIKANIPTRIAFQVSSKIDSRTILDQQGAEQLLGYGDMLYLPPGAGIPIRIHGAFVSDEEVHRVVAALKKQGEPEYLEEVLKGHEEDGNDSNASEDEEQDPLYDQAVNIVIESRKASISYVQRRLKIGYNRAARILESMERAGVVSAMEGNGSREVLVPKSSREDD